MRSRCQFVTYRVVWNDLNELKRSNPVALNLSNLHIFSHTSVRKRHDARVISLLSCFQDLLDLAHSLFEDEVKDRQARCEFDASIHYYNFDFEFRVSPPGYYEI